MPQKLETVLKKIEEISNDVNRQLIKEYHTYLIVRETGTNYQKEISSLILAPYLINIKKLPFQHCFQIIKEWFDKCNSLEKLDHSSSFNSKISYSLKNAENKQIGPMSQYKIKKDSNYSKLYTLLKKKEILKI